MKPDNKDNDDAEGVVLSQKDQDDIERMQSVNNLLALANGTVEMDYSNGETGVVEDDVNITVDTMALSVSDDYQQEVQQQMSEITEGVKAMRRIRHNHKEKERKDKIKIDYQEIRNFLPESYFSDKKQITHHDMLQFCLKFMRTLVHQNKLLGGSSCDDVQYDLSSDAEEIARLRRENGELRNEIARYRRIIDTTGLPTDVEPDQLVVSWQLLGSSSSEFTGIDNAGANRANLTMHQSPTALLNGIAAPNSTSSQYCNTGITNAGTSSLGAEINTSQQLGPLYGANSGTAGNGDYSLFSDLLNATPGEGSVVVPRLATQSSNGVFQCVVQPGMMYHGGPNGMQYMNQNGPLGMPNGVQYFGHHAGQQNNMVATNSPMPSFVQQNGLMTTTTANMPFMQHNGNIVFLPQVSSSAAPPADHELNNRLLAEAGLGDIIATTAANSNDTSTIDRALSPISDAAVEMLPSDSSESNPKETCDLADEQNESSDALGSMVALKDETGAMDQGPEATLSSFVDGLMMAGETSAGNEPCENNVDINHRTVDCKDQLLVSASSVATPGVGNAVLSHEETGTNQCNVTLTNGDDSTCLSEQAKLVSAADAPVGPSQEIPDTETVEQIADVSETVAEPPQIRDGSDECGDNTSSAAADSLRLTSVLESPVSLPPDADKSITDVPMFPVAQLEQADHFVSEHHVVQSMPSQTFSFDSQQQFVAQAHQQFSVQQYGAQQGQLFGNQPPQPYGLHQPAQFANQQQPTQFLQQTQSFIGQPQQFISHAQQQFNAQQFGGQQPQQFAVPQQTMPGDATGQSMQGTLVLHNGQLLLVNSQQTGVPQATQLGNGGPTAIGTNPGAAFGMANPGAANTIFVNQFGNSGALPQPPMPAPAMPQLGSNQTVMVNTPTGPMALNTMPSQPNQHPSALILPNGQIVPVVTQPNLLFPSQQCTPVTGGLLVPSGQNQPVVNFISSSVGTNRVPMLTTNSFSGPIVSLSSGNTAGNVMRGVVQFPVGARPAMLAPSPMVQGVAAQVPIRIPAAAVVTTGCTTTMANIAATTSTAGLRQHVPNLPQTVMATMTAEGTIILTMPGADQTPTKHSAKSKKTAVVQRPLMPKPSLPKSVKAVDLVSSAIASTSAVGFITPTRVPLAVQQHQAQQQCTILPNGFIVNSGSVSGPAIGVSCMSASACSPASFINTHVNSVAMKALSVSVGNDQTSLVSSSIAGPRSTTDILAKATESIFMLSPSNGEQLSPTGLYLGTNDNQLHIDLNSEQPLDSVPSSALAAVKGPPSKARSRPKKKPKIVEASSSMAQIQMAQSQMIFDQLESSDGDDDQTDISDFSDLIRLEPMTPAPSANTFDGRELALAKDKSMENITENEDADDVQDASQTAGEPCRNKLSSMGDADRIGSLSNRSPASSSTVVHSESSADENVSLITSGIQAMEDFLVPQNAVPAVVDSVKCNNVSSTSSKSLVENTDTRSSNVGLESRDKIETATEPAMLLPEVTVDIHSTSSKSLFERFNELLASPPLASPQLPVAAQLCTAKVSTVPAKTSTVPAEVSSASEKSSSSPKKDSTVLETESQEDFIIPPTSTQSAVGGRVLEQRSGRRQGKRLATEKSKTENVQDGSSGNAIKESIQKSNQSVKDNPQLVLSPSTSDDPTSEDLSINLPEPASVSAVCKMTKVPEPVNRNTAWSSRKSEKAKSISKNFKEPTASLPLSTSSAIKPNKLATAEVLALCTSPTHKTSDTVIDAAISEGKLEKASNNASSKSHKRSKKSHDLETGKQLEKVECSVAEKETDHLQVTNLPKLSLAPTDAVDNEKSINSKRKDSELSNFVCEMRSDTVDLSESSSVATPDKTRNRKKAAIEPESIDDLPPPVLVAIDSYMTGCQDIQAEQRDMMEEATQTTRKELKSIAGEKRAKKQSSKSSPPELPATAVEKTTDKIPETVTFDANELLNMVDVVENMAVETQTERIKKSHSRKHRSSTSINADGELEIPCKRKKKSRDPSKYNESLPPTELDRLPEKSLLNGFTKALKTEKNNGTDESQIQRVAMAPKNDPLDVFDFLMDEGVQQLDSSDVYSAYRNPVKKRSGNDLLSDVGTKSVTTATSAPKSSISSKTSLAKLAKSCEQLGTQEADVVLAKNLADKENHQSVTTSVSSRLDGIVAAEISEESRVGSSTAVKDERSSALNCAKPTIANEPSELMEEGKTSVAARHSNIATLARHVAPQKMPSSASRGATKLNVQLARARQENDFCAGNDPVSSLSSSRSAETQDISGSEVSEDKRGLHTRSSRDSSSVVQLSKKQEMSEDPLRPSTLLNEVSYKQAPGTEERSKRSQSAKELDSTSTSVNRDESVLVTENNGTCNLSVSKDSSLLRESTGVDVPGHSAEDMKSQKVVVKNRTETISDNTVVEKNNATSIADYQLSTSCSDERTSVEIQNVKSRSHQAVQLVKEGSKSAKTSSQSAKDSNQHARDVSLSSKDTLQGTVYDNIPCTTKDAHMYLTSAAELSTKTHGVSPTTTDSSRSLSGKASSKELHNAVDLESNSFGLRAQSDATFGLMTKPRSHHTEPLAESNMRGTSSKLSLVSSRNGDVHTISPSLNEAIISKYSQQISDSFSQGSLAVSNAAFSSHHGNRRADEAFSVPPVNNTNSAINRSSMRDSMNNNTSPAGSGSSKTAVSSDRNRSSINDNAYLVNSSSTSDRVAGSASRTEYARKGSGESGCRAPAVDHGGGGRSYDSNTRERSYGESCVIDNSSSRGHSSGGASYGTSDSRPSSSSGHVAAALTSHGGSSSTRSNCAQKTSGLPSDGRVSRSSGSTSLQVSGMYNTSGGTGGMDCSGTAKQRSSCQEEARHQQQQMDSSDYFTHRPTSSSSCAVQNLSSSSSSIVDPFHYPYAMFNGGSAANGTSVSASQHHHDMALASYASSIAADYSLVGRNPFYSFPTPFGFDPQPPPASLRCPSGRFSPLSHNLPSCGVEKQPSAGKSTQSAAGPLGMSSTGSGIRSGQDSAGSTAEVNKARHPSHHQQQALSRENFSSSQYGQCGGVQSTNSAQFLEPMAKDSSGPSRSTAHRLPNSSASSMSSSASRRNRSPAMAGQQASLDQSGSYGPFSSLANTLTSPPLHHPPSTLSDRHCAAASHTSGPGGFDLSAYHSPAAVNQFSPNLTNLGFDPPLLNFSSARDCASSITAQSKKTTDKDANAKHSSSSGHTTTLQHKPPAQPVPPKAAARSSSSSKASKKSNSKAAPPAQPPPPAVGSGSIAPSASSMYDMDMFDSRCMTPYFGLTGGVSPNRGALQAAASDSLSYFPSNFFSNPTRPLTNATKTLQHRHDANLFNAFSSAGRVAANGLGGLNFQPGTPGFGMDAAAAAHMAGPMMTHAPAHGFGAFGSLFDVSGVSMPPDQRESLTGISPSKFGHHHSGSNSASSLAQDSLHHQQSAGAGFGYGGRAAQHMLHDFNALLGGHHQHHAGFDARTAAAAISGAMGPPFAGHHAAASFGMGALNFPMHNL